MEEGDEPAARPGPRPFVDQALPVCPSVGECPGQVGHQEGEMVQSLTAALEEPEYRPLVSQGLQQFKQSPAGIEKGDSDPVVRQLVALGDDRAKGFAVKADRRVEVVHGHADVVKMH